MIGGATDGTRNLISGNGSNGIFVLFAAAQGTSIQGNRIGTDVTGTQAIGNGSFGIRSIQTPQVTVGGSNTGEGNHIAGTLSHGVFFLDNSNESVIQNNLIGADPTGSTAVANGGDGVRLTGTSNTTVSGNVISGNAAVGILLSDSANTNTVQGNLIGTDIAGVIAVANATGLRIANSTNNTVGGLVSGEGNVVSGNEIAIELLSNSSGNRLLGNLIGTDAPGSGRLGNTAGSVSLSGLFG